MTKHGREADDHGLEIAAARAAAIAANPAADPEANEKWGTVGEDVRTPTHEDEDPMCQNARAQAPGH